MTDTSDGPKAAQRPLRLLSINALDLCGNPVDGERFAWVEQLMLRDRRGASALVTQN
ncbi:hypothetical protein [Cryptosporangium sp. NPDC048952]|uniref:hypothetical protein n=1 Tax=Cryptosporangium sp. NPDC048952 TaxID=3363961 RepID=UPI00370F8523